MITMASIIPVTIAASGTTSGVVDILDKTLSGIIMPAEFTGTALTFLVSDALDGTFVELQDGSGSAYTLTVSAAIAIGIEKLTLLGGWRYIKVKSGSTEAAERVLKLAVRQFV